MKSQLQIFARQSGKRARVKARRLAAMLQAYQRDPISNYSLRGESAGLAKSVSFCLRQAEIVGRIISNMEDAGRQSLFIDMLQHKESASANGSIR